MAYLTIQIQTNPNAASPAVGPSIGDLSQLLGGTAANGASKPDVVLNNLTNFLDAIKQGTVSCTVSVASSSNADLTITPTSFLNGQAGVFTNVLGTGAVNISTLPLGPINKK
jgi:hypothetical protein